MVTYGYLGIPLYWHTDIAMYRHNEVLIYGNATLPGTDGPRQGGIRIARRWQTTINYPKAIGADWDVEVALGDELERVRKCMPARILFLDAPDDTLRQRKQSDPNRARSSFEYYLKHLMPLKRTWFSKMSNVDYLLVDNMSRQEVAMRVKRWVDLCIASYS